MLLGLKTWFIREHVGLLKLANTYDILDPATSQQVGIAQERPGNLILILRLFIDKRMLPTHIFIYEGANPENSKALSFSIHRGFVLLRSRIEVHDSNGQLLGWFVSKLLSLGGAFTVFNAQGQEVAEVKGDWKGWNFRFLTNGGLELGNVAKQWAGAGKELFTSADNYVIALAREPEPDTARLLLAAGLAIDTIFKE